MRLKQISKRSLAILLTVLMVLSSLMVGTITTANASVGTGIVYFDNTDTKWSSVYMFIGHNGYIRSYAMSAVSGKAGIYSYTIPSSEWSDATGFYFANGGGGVTSGTSSKNINTSASSLGLSARTTTLTGYTATQCFVPSATSGTAITGTWMSVDDAIASHTGVVVGDLKSVLNGSKVMYYGGELVSWNQTTFNVFTNNNNSGSNIVASGTMSIVKSIDGSTEFAVLCTPNANYYMGHQGWASNLNTTVEAGATYIVRGAKSSSATGFTQKDINGSNYLYSYKANNTATTTATTNITTPNVGIGEKISASTSTSAGTSSIGNTNSFKYYIGDSSGNFYSTTLTSGKVDTSALAAGDYTLKTVLFDGNIYVLADTDNFTITDVAYEAPVFSNATTALSVDRDAILDLSSAIAATCSCGSDVTYDIGCTPTTGVTLIVTNKTFKSSAAGTYTLTVVAKNANDTSKTTTKKITVTVNPLDVIVTAGASTGGTVTVNGGATATVKEGTEVTLANTPADGYEFVKYQANGSDITTPYKPTATATITGVFNKKVFTLTDSTADKTQGTVEMKVNGTVSNKFSIGDTVVFTAKPAAGYSVNTLTVDGATVTSPYTLTVTKENLKNISASATFTVNDYTITYNKETGIDLTVPTSAKYNENVTVTINSITPGYECKFVNVNGTQYEVNGSTVTFKMPAENVTITTDTAVKALQTPAVKINGSNTVNGVGDTYTTTLTPVVTPATGDAAEVDYSKGQFTVNSDKAHVELVNDGVFTEYKFYADEPGTYTVTYTGVIVSTVDGKTTKTGTNTLTITVSYSATQQAYKDLESVFEAKGHEIASNYDTSSDYWKDYETAISTATGLLTGMPTADDDEKVAAYNAAATALETAYEGLANCSNESTVYILTQKSSNVKIYSWDGNNCDLPNNTGKAMTLVANYNNSRYLWKTTFKGTCGFNIYSSTSSTTDDSTKLTGSIYATEAGKIYFFNRNDSANSTATDYETSYEMLALTGNGISVNSSVKMMQGTAFTLKDAFPVSVKSSVYSANPSLYTVTYYIDGEKVTGTTWKTEVQGQHSVYAVITGGTSNGATYETVTTKTVNFEVTEDLTTTWTYVGYSDSNKTIESGYNHVPMLKGTMNGVAFAYYENLDRTGYDKFFLVANNKSVYNYNSSIYVKDSLSSYATDIPIYDHSGKVAKADTGNSHYIVVFYPNTNYGTWNGVTINNTSSSPKVVCYEDLPGDGYTDKYRVIIENGSGNQVDSNNARGESYLDGDTSKVSIKKDVTDLTIQMSTDIKSMTNYLGDFTGYAQKVYGYSILMEMRDGSTQVASVSGKAISSPAVGKYTASYTFPENIKSAKITPVFVSSDEFATARGLTFTTVYLKLTPGNNLYENTYEPKCYTWRTNDESVKVVSIDGKSYAGRPEGVYPGQKMLYVGSDMYMAIVETKIKGILFNDGHSGVTQTFDYNEFIKLQDLGYNNITFEPKKNTQETVASSMNSTYAGSGLKVYSSTSNSSTTTITSTLTKAEFQLDVNIEGYYIDVFGNKLVDTEGNPVLQSALREEMTAKGTEINTSTEITALLNKMGKDLTTDAGRRTLYGARYGWYTEEGFYGMTYGIRVYYFNHLNKMVSQQVSGYGTIEGAQSPNNNQLTNAVYAKNNNILLQHAQGNKPDASAAQTFTTGYELIPEDYKNVPYLVSYKIKTNSRATTSEQLQTDHYRIDGKWYYQAATPQITVNMKTGLMDENDNLVMTNGVITDQGTTYGTGTINNATTITVDQGTQAAINANPITGYKFVGFYDKTGKLISTQNPDTFTCAIGTDIYAVFQKLGEGTLTVTNGVYRGTNPKDGEGNGIVGVELTIFNADGSVKETLKGVNSVTANITEGEGYQWKITGKPTGVDKFIAFRQPEEQVDGTYYYSKLDVEEYLSSDSNGMWTYAPDAVTEFDWDDYDTKSLSFNFVTDFQKVSVYARLNYHYINRFNEPRTYTVNNVLLSDEEIANNFTPSKDKIKKYAPPIDEVFTDCEWNVDGTGVLESGDSVANLTAIQTKKQFNTFILDEEVSPSAKKITAYYDSVVELNAADKDNFKYWKQYEIDSTGKKVGDGVIFSYDPTVSIRVSFNRYFEAVYEGEVVDVVTSVQDPLYTREKYTAEDGTVKDYIYVDFLLQFETCLDDSFKDFVKYSDYRVKYGIILERDTTVQYTAKDAEAGTKPADKAPTYDNRTYENVEAVVEKLGYNVADGGSTGGWTTETNTSDPEYNYYYNLFDLTNYADSLTSLGRIDYFLMFDNNVEVNRNHVYNVYSYVIYDTTIINDNGESEKVTKVVISTPKVMNIREIGDRTDGTN